MEKNGEKTKEINAYEIMKQSKKIDRSHQKIRKNSIEIKLDQFSRNDNNKKILEYFTPNKTSANNEKLKIIKKNIKNKITNKKLELNETEEKVDKNSVNDTTLRFSRYSQKLSANILNKNLNHSFDICIQHNANPLDELSSQATSHMHVRESHFTSISKDSKSYGSNTKFL